MKNKKTVLWFALIVLATISACAQQYDTRLNGTWKENESDQTAGGHIYKFNSGNYEYLDEDGNPYNKGTYTTSNGKITKMKTHVKIRSRKQGLDGFYSKDELIKDHSYDPEYFTDTFKYVINGNKLTLTFDNRDDETYTLVSRDVPEKKSSGSVSSFPGKWSLVEGPTRGNPEELDLLKDGTGVVDGLGISWKIENGRFYIISSLFGFSSIFNVSGSTLTLTKDDGVVLKYKKK